MKLESALLSAALLLGFGAAGCSKEYVRGSDDPSINHSAMSTNLDQRDIDEALEKILNELRGSRVMQVWQSHGGNDTVAIMPFSNETSEHIDSMLKEALLRTEKWLLKAGTVAIISREKQSQMIAEVEGGKSGVFDPKHSLAYGKQMQAKYIITGTATAADERAEGARRVQYGLHMEIIEVETSRTMFLGEAPLTKMVR